MILRGLALIWLFVTLAGVATGQGRAAQCWYPLEGPVGCSDAPDTDADRVLKPGFHAIYTEAVNRYGHNIMGDLPEWGRLQFYVQGSAQHGPYVSAELVLPETRVFEDIAPRLVDVTGNGTPEIVVVESDVNKGARLAVYQFNEEARAITLLAATPFIGRPFRWLAPAGVADFNGDGVMDLAYVDRPHLLKILRVWSLKGNQLQEIASLPYVTNHRIGDETIAGGVRDCGQGPEMVMLDAKWQSILAVRLAGKQLDAQNLGAHKGPKSMARALACNSP